jgi:isocitrate dehydrogenase
MKNNNGCVVVCVQCRSQVGDANATELLPYAITSQTGFIHVMLLSGNYVKHWHALVVGGLGLGTSTDCT